MLSRSFLAVLSATVLSATLSDAQSVSQLGGPANYPPASFTGQQYVDNDGCVFLKAGFGGRVTWVPRVKANHRPLCDFPPTFGTAVAAAVAADMAPDSQAMAPAAPQAAAPVAAAPAAMTTPAQPRPPLMANLFGKPYVGNPIPLVPAAPALQVAPASQVAAAPVAIAQPVVAQPTYQTTVNSAQAQCVPGSPRLETVLLRSGGTALVCTKGDGTLNGWRPPVFPQGVIGGGLTPRMMRGATLTTTTYATVQTADNAIPTPPKGYRLAWKDGRLNPLRGVGTAQGQARQDQVWTRDIPARLVTAAPVRVISAGRDTSGTTNTTVSTMSARAPVGAYVQVGTFGQPANAADVKARLAALGMPVSTSKITSKGHVLQVVYAGPFASLTQAQTALTTARKAGFPDAILK